jgi:hypothetical protein
MNRNIKIKVFIVMIKEEVLKEKLKYLILMSSNPKFEILSFDVHFEYDNYDEKDIIREYTVDIKFDYYGRIGESPRDMGMDIISMMNQMKTHIGSWIITPEGKFSQDYDAYVDEGLIWDIEFSFDEKHEFNTSFKVTYPE